MEVCELLKSKGCQPCTVIITQGEKPTLVYQGETIQQVGVIPSWVITATILIKIVTKKITPFGKSIPRALVTMLKHEIVLVIT